MLVEKIIRAALAFAQKVRDTCRDGDFVARQNVRSWKAFHYRIPGGPYALGLSSLNFSYIEQAICLVLLRCHHRFNAEALRVPKNDRIGDPSPPQPLPTK